MLPAEHDEELLPEQRKVVQPLVDLIGPAIDCSLELAGEQNFEIVSLKRRKLLVKNELVRLKKLDAE